MQPSPYSLQGVCYAASEVSVMEPPRCPSWSLQGVHHTTSEVSTIHPPSPPPYTLRDSPHSPFSSPPPSHPPTGPRSRLIPTLTLRQLPTHPRLVQQPNRRRRDLLQPVVQLLLRRYPAWHRRWRWLGNYDVCDGGVGEHACVPEL
jgi:hypothetical protein